MNPLITRDYYIYEDDYEGMRLVVRSRAKLSSSALKLARALMRRDGLLGKVGDGYPTEGIFDNRLRPAWSFSWQKQST